MYGKYLNDCIAWVAGVSPANVTLQLILFVMSWMLTMINVFLQALLFFVTTTGGMASWVHGTAWDWLLTYCRSEEGPTVEVAACETLLIAATQNVIIMGMLSGLLIVVFFKVLKAILEFLFMRQIRIETLPTEVDSPTVPRLSEGSEFLLEANVGLNNSYVPTKESMKELFKGDILVFMGNCHAGWVTRISDTYVLGLQHVVETAVSSSQVITLVSPFDLTKGVVWNPSDETRVFSMSKSDGSDYDLGVWTVPTHVFSLLKVQVAKLNNARIDTIIKTNTQELKDGKLILMKSLGTMSNSPYYPIVHHNAATVPGSSGSSLRNAANEVVGVHAGCFVKQGVNFGYQIDLVKRWLEDRFDVQLESEIGKRGEKKHHSVSLADFNLARSTAENLSANIQFFSGGKLKKYAIAPSKDDSNTILIAGKPLFDFKYEKGNFVNWLDRFKAGTEPGFNRYKIKPGSSSVAISDFLTEFAAEALQGNEYRDFIHDLKEWFKGSTSKSSKASGFDWADVESGDMENVLAIALEIIRKNKGEGMAKSEASSVNRQDFHRVKENTPKPPQSLKEHTEENQVKLNTKVEISSNKLETSPLQHQQTLKPEKKVRRRQMKKLQKKKQSGPQQKGKDIKENSGELKQMITTTQQDSSMQIQNSMVSQQVSTTSSPSKQEIGSTQLSSNHTISSPKISILKRNDLPTSGTLISGSHPALKKQREMEKLIQSQDS